MSFVKTDVTDSADQLFGRVLSDVLTRAEELSTGPTREVGARYPSLDLNNYQITLSNPRNRLLLNPIRDVNLCSLVARFVWMMSGSDQLADIAFFEPQVMAYSDDSLSVPGSDYGARLFRPRPGLNQIKGVVDRLKDDPGTRRASAVVWLPDDAVRDSHDIPCTFGLFYYIRNGRLHATTIMRSNAAYRLLPANVFEFTLLAELVSVMVSKPLGEYTHWAMSMHVFEAEVEKATQAVEAATNVVSAEPMPAMPSTTTWDQVVALVMLMQQIRVDASSLTTFSYQDIVERAEGQLEPYWADLAKILLVYALLKRSLPRAAEDVITRITHATFRTLLRRPRILAVAADQIATHIESDPILLESRTSLLRLKERRTDVDWREFETVWRRWSARYETDRQATRLRNVVARSEDEWAEEIDQPNLFPDL